MLKKNLEGACVSKMSDKKETLAALGDGLPVQGSSVGYGHELAVKNSPRQTDRKSVV